MYVTLQEWIAALPLKIQVHAAITGWKDKKPNKTVIYGVKSLHFMVAMSSVDEPVKIIGY